MYMYKYIRISNERNKCPEVLNHKQIAKRAVEQEGEREVNVGQTERDDQRRTVDADGKRIAISV